MLVAQAALVWFQGNESQIKEFIETGNLGGGEEIIPYDPELLKAIVGSGKVV